MPFDHFHFIKIETDPPNLLGGKEKKTKAAPEFFSFDFVILFVITILSHSLTPLTHSTWSNKNSSFMILVL